MTLAVERTTHAGFPLTTYTRRVAAVGCAGLVAGALVAFPLGRIAMRMLAVLNPEDTGSVTDDGFLVGRITLGGSGQLLLAAVQASLTGAALFLLVRPLLLGPRWLRTATLAVGVGTSLAALLVSSDSFDFLALEPRWLPIVLFWSVPVLHVVVFATLAEHWLADGSWFQRAPVSSVRWTLAIWVLTGAAVVFVVPLLALALVGALLLWRFPPPLPARHVALWIGRVLLVAIFVAAVVDLVGDTQRLVG